MLADGTCYNITKQNKHKHQLIHKKFNKVQHASKHYGTSELIQKRKHPVKQRKDRKKFKVQRTRKKMYKNMAFDYNDFLDQNKSENYKRIQTRPTISYYSQHRYKQLDINAIFTDYYHQNNKQQPETLYNHIPIWQCDTCTYINVEKLEFCAICNYPFKYDYDNHGFNNDPFYSIKYVNAKSKSNRKSIKNAAIKKVCKSKNNCNDFETYWDEMAKCNSNYEEFKANRKPAIYKKKQLLIVLSIHNKQNGTSLNYKPNQPMYGRIAHKNELFFDPIIITKILHYYPFYELPVCLEPKVYQDLSNNKYKNNYYGNSPLQYELSLIKRQIEQQLQPKSFKNYTLEQMISNYKTSVQTIEKSAIDSAQILSSTQNIIKIDKGISMQWPTFDIQLDVLMFKKPSNVVNKYNYMFSSNGTDLDEIKQETFLLKEINLKTYNEKTFTHHERELDIVELKAAKQTNIWFDMFQDEESDDEKIVDGFPQPENNSYHFIFTNEYDRNIDICTSLERFSKSYDYTEFDLKNNKLINIAKTCVDIIFENDNCQFRFDEKHIPYYNLLPLSFTISRILYEYLPAMDIINNIFIPMIGYNKLYYVSINTQIRSPQKNKMDSIKETKRVESQNEIEKNENVVDDHDIAASYSILYSQLIAMGFDGEISLQAAKRHSNNMNAAIDWIRNAQIIETKKKKNTITKYNYDINWEAIALYEEEEESSSSFHGCRYCGSTSLFCDCDSSSDDSSSSD